MKLLLFSADVYFLKVFSEYLSREKLEYDLFSYSEEEVAEQAVKTQNFDLILCEQGYLKRFEEEKIYVTLGMHTIYPGDGQKGCLNIYQRASQVKEELEYMVQVLAGKTLVDGQNATTLVSFFSTEGGSGKTTLAYLTAAECAKTKRTLYMNLEPLAVTDCLYTADEEKRMEDILLSFDEKREETTAVLLNAIDKTAEGVYVLPTLGNIGDYLELSSTVVLQMLHAVSFMSGVENIILDLPGTFSDFTETILSESKKIVWVYNDGRNGKRKMEKVQNDPYLKSRGILSKSIFVLNRCENQSAGEEYQAAFPVSRSLNTAGRISKILEINEAFEKGCRNIAGKTGLL
ncbi:MAG: hypothetical protein J6J44_12980 [Lachnospiraceae bacterium]|nr:hypothetical protein [Lachnospiraceae bacterium]